MRDGTEFIFQHELQGGEKYYNDTDENNTEYKIIKLCHYKKRICNTVCILRMSVLVYSMIHVCIPCVHIHIHIHEYLTI